VPAPVVATKRSNVRLAWGAAATAIVLAVVAAFIAWRAVRSIEAPQVMRFSAPNTVPTNFL